MTVALVALVLVLTGAGAATAAPGIANGVGQGFRRALCMVTRQDCVTARAQACTVRTGGTSVDATAKLSFLKIGRHIALLRSVSSDGSVTMTLLDNMEAGLVAGIGASGHLQVGSVDLSGGARAQLLAVAQLGGGRTWKLKDTAAADDLQNRIIEKLAGQTTAVIPGAGAVLNVAQGILHRGSGRELPKPSSNTVTGKLSGSATVKGPAGSDLKLGLGASLGFSFDREHGGGTFLLNLSGSATAEVAEGWGGGGIGADVGVQITIDRHLHLTQMTLTGTGQASAFAALTREGRPASERTSNEQSVSVQATLDLADPVRRAAVRRLLTALLPDPHHHGDLADAAKALAPIVRDEARLDVTRYGKREHKYGVGLEVELGAVTGIDVDVARSAGELIDALTKPAGGVWERRFDCLDKV